MPENSDHYNLFCRKYLKLRNLGQSEIYMSDHFLNLLQNSENGFGEEDRV